MAINYVQRVGEPGFAEVNDIAHNINKNKAYIQNASASLSQGIAKVKKARFPRGDW